jgi:type II secretory pathway component GspD/PulD (secretin)
MESRGRCPNVASPHGFRPYRLASQGGHCLKQALRITDPRLLAAIAGACACAQTFAQPAKATPVRQPAPVKDVQPAAPKPAAQPPVSPPDIRADGDLVTLSAFAEPVTLSTFVELVATTLEINITVVGDVPGTVRFNSPVPLRKADLLPLLRTLLEQQGWTITQDRFGLYTVSAMNQIMPGVAGNLSTTRVFQTPFMRPTTLKQAIEGLVGPPQPSPTGQRQYAYLDDIGVIIATDAPGKLDAIRELIDAVTRQHAGMEFIRYPLNHVSAAVARDRALQLLGMVQQTSGTRGAQPGAEGAPAAVAGRNLATLFNLPERLSVDQQGNALIFRGTPEEAEHVRRVLAVVDVPNELIPRSYRAGRSAVQVAEIARGRGLGEVVTIADLSTATQIPFGGIPGREGMQPRMQQPAQIVGGPLVVVDETRGMIIYYGTESQQEQLQALLDQLDTEADTIVTRVYKVRNADAVDLADIINGLITNSAPVASAPLLPGDEGGQARRGFRSSARRASQPRQQQLPRTQQSGTGGEEGFTLDEESTFVYPDEKNNQLLVKAPAGQQAEFARLIERLDLRRPQVYIEAKIVSVTADDRLRLAFETQLINASGTGGVFTQSFGLATYPTSGDILSRPAVNALTGFTGAVIRSDMVPIVMNALANETDSRIISNPQLLVDDNEEASVVSLDQQPTSTISRGTSGQTDLVTAGDYAEAGTTLRITPQISGGGHLRLRYEIELSAFTGEAQTVGGTVLPPPKLTNTLNSDSITVPSDYTVVIGGLVVDAKTRTIAKVPLLGDIPLAGLLFQDRKTGNRKTVLYVFLTPRILRDPTFNDLKLLTKGPMTKVDLPPDVPPLKPSITPILAPWAAPTETSPQASTPVVTGTPSDPTWPNPD